MVRWSSDSTLIPIRSGQEDLLNGCFLDFKGNVKEAMLG